MLNDVIFKIVFGQERSEALLRVLLNALLQLDGEDRICELTILNPQLDRQSLADKGVILDVRARDGVGRLYNVEVQMAHDRHFVRRSLYYLSRLFSSQMEAGDAYADLSRTIALAIVDFRLFPDLEELHTRFRFHDAACAQELSDAMEIHYIELVKFKKDSPSELRTPFEKWLHVLKFGELYERNLQALPPILRDEEGVPMAIDKMREARSSDEVRQMIWDREQALHDANSRTREWIEQARDEGWVEGHKEGHKEGHREGHKEGHKEGRDAERKEVARRLLERGFDARTVEECTGVPAEELSSGG